MNKILPLMDWEDANVSTLVYPVSMHIQLLRVDKEEEEGKKGKEGEHLEEENITVASNSSEDLPPNPYTIGISGLLSKVPFIPHSIFFLRADYTVLIVSEKMLLFIF